MKKGFLLKLSRRKKYEMWPKWQKRTIGAIFLLFSKTSKQPEWTLIWVKVSQRSLVSFHQRYQSSSNTFPYKFVDEKSGVSKSQDSNPWLRGEKRERLLCAMPTPGPLIWLEKSDPIFLSYCRFINSIDLSSGLFISCVFIALQGDVS